MSKRPAFQFYAGDWLRNAKLRRCSLAARGAWIDVLCLLHDAEEYGVLRWPLADIAHAAGLPVKYLRELADKGVLKGADSGAQAYVYTPRHAGKAGTPVPLLDASEGPCWYCSRFVRDEHIRKRRGSDTRFDEDRQPSPKTGPKATPNTKPIPPIGDGKGDGPSFAFASAVAQEQEPHSVAHAVPPDRVTGTEAGQVCARLKREAGLVQVNPSDPRLIAALDAGVSPDLIVEIAKANPKKPQQYAVATALGQHNDAVSQTAGAQHGNPAARPGRNLSAVDRVRFATGQPDDGEPAGRVIDAGPAQAS